jgi:hypothetical protein
MLIHLTNSIWLVTNKNVLTGTHSSTFLISIYSFQEVNANPNNYDAWFDYLRLVESEGNLEEIRETYERAIANVPPTKVSELLLLPLL